MRSHAYLTGARDPLHLLRHALAPGTILCLRGEPADRLVYVLDGEIEVDGWALAKGSSMIVEFGAETDFVANEERGAVLLVFNQAVRPADARAGGHVHLLPRASVPGTHDLGTQDEIGGGLHADAGCPTCTVWLHENDFHCKEGTVVPLHSHSADEIIFVTAGEIKLGNRCYGPGTALAIAANTVYGFEAAPKGLSFVNFRAASPTVTTPRGVHDERQMWISRLGAPPYANVTAAHAGLTGS
jgi:quercetin dioxygenase-like cupin family protein